MQKKMDMIRHYDVLISCKRPIKIINSQNISLNDLSEWRVYKIMALGSSNDCGKIGGCRSFADSKMVYANATIVMCRVSGHKSILFAKVGIIIGISKKMK